MPRRRRDMTSCLTDNFYASVSRLPDTSSDQSAFGMKLATLIHQLPITLVHGSGETAITSITEDSRTVCPGALFIARRGLTSDGQAFIPAAVNAGAAAVLTDDASSRPSALPTSVTRLVSRELPRATALLAERFLGNPSSKLTLIGVTGTNGKTTTTSLIHQMLNRPGTASRDRSRRCGLIGTVLVDDGGEPRPASLTTPPAIELSHLYRAMVDHGCEAAVMEVSSHALAQQRVAALAFDIAVFTNLSGDHLDYHGSETTYADAKAMLFELLPTTGWAIVNADDPLAARMLRDCCADHVLQCSLRDADADCSAEIRNETITHVDAHFHGPWGSFDIRLPLCGRHNVMNALQAAAVGHAVGLTRDAIRNALAQCTAPPGRLEPVTKPGDSFAVYVDYAHTDDALDNVLRALRPLVPDNGRLCVVFGCGGDRDRTKRPRMAQAAWRYADAVLVTSDNPRTEDPARIVEEVMAGVPAERRGDTTVIVDRREAIHAAVERARPGDVILIAGKGHEDYQIIGGTKRPFDDRLVAREALTLLAFPTGAPTTVEARTT